METLRVKFVSAALGSDTENSALVAAERSLPRKSPKRVWFNDAVEVWLYRFWPWEAQERRINKGSTRRLWDELKRRYAERQGSACTATAERDAKLCRMPRRLLADTGASWHMISLKDLDDKAKRQMILLERAVK